MTDFIFAPAPNLGRSEHAFVQLQNELSEGEVKRIIALGESYNPKPAHLGISKMDDSSIRISEASWIPLEKESTWLYNRLGKIARRLNGEFYGFDLYGFSEDFQYTVYRGDVKGHYSWHVDTLGGIDVPPRKFTLVIQLSDPSEYEGGELQVQTGHEPMTVEKELGKVIAFPSYTLHRVTPVTKGVRRTLALWVTGPSFR